MFFSIEVLHMFVYGNFYPLVPTYGISPAVLYSYFYLISFWLYQIISTSSHFSHPEKIWKPKLCFPLIPLLFCLLPYFFALLVSKLQRFACACCSSFLSFHLFLNQLWSGVCPYPVKVTGNLYCYIQWLTWWLFSRIDILDKFFSVLFSEIHMKTI